jgi:hypothetical protein
MSEKYIKYVKILDFKINLLASDICLEISFMY